MLGNLTLPYPYSNGGQGYVWGWIEPNGVVDNTVQQTLAQYGYLCSRETTQSMGTVPYPNWNPTFGIYDLTTTSRYMDGDTLQDLNSVFDSVYASGGIYHVWASYWTKRLDTWRNGLPTCSAYSWQTGCLVRRIRSPIRLRIHTRPRPNNVGFHHPTTQDMDVGQSQTFTCSVSSNDGNGPYTYQWYVNGTQVSGTQATWNFVPSQAGHFNVYGVATGSDGVAAQSNTVTYLGLR